MESRTYDELREQYRPDVVDYLLVGESPPAPQGGKLRFFYSSVLAHPDSLYRAVAAAFLDADDDELSRKSEMLNRLREKRVWLVDVMDEPINHIDKRAERCARIKAASDVFVDRCKNIAPRKGVLVCQKSVRKIVGPKLEKAGLQVFSQPLNFPRADRPDWQRQFIEGVRAFRDGTW